mmetsp:Transcript_16536/g.27335  ORF Transcript_16536/g.27335 Transcript_16536/m.27335 type:complete len:503 (-) Transcript_16536:147-1655(-)
MHSRNAFSCGSNFLVKERETVTGPGIHLSCSSTSTPSSTYARNVNTSIRGTHELFFYTACIVFAPRKRLCGSCSVNRGSLGGLVLVCRGSEAVDVFRSSDLQRGAVTDLLLQNWGASMSEVNAWCVEYPIEELQNVLEPFHSFHQNFNGVEGGVVECLRKSPMETVEHLNNLNLLYEYGISSSDMLVLLRRFPRLLILQKATILTSLKTLNELGITQEVGCRLLLVVPQILARPTCFSESIRFLHAIGLSRGDTSDLVSRFPNVLVLRKRTCLQPKWRFLTEVMGRGIQDVIAWPAFFGVSLENRIIPQWEQAKADNTTHLSIRSLFGGKSKPSSAGTAAAAAAAAGSRLPKLDESSDKVREFLQEELGLTDAEIIKMMQRWAPLANLSVVHKLEPSLDYLMHTLHWTKERLRRAVCAYPPLLALTAGSRDVVAFVLHLGVPEDKLSCIHPRMLQAHPATVSCPFAAKHTLSVEPFFAFDPFSHRCSAVPHLSFRCAVLRYA